MPPNGSSDDGDANLSLTEPYYGDCAKTSAQGRQALRAFRAVSKESLEIIELSSPAFAGAGSQRREDSRVTQ